jgi:hypothetical protein
MEKASMTWRFSIRSNTQVPALEDQLQALRKSLIEIIGGQKLYEKKEIKDSDRLSLFDS